jgi:signal transduction histidine kinase
MELWLGFLFAILAGLISERILSCRLKNKVVEPLLQEIADLARQEGQMEVARQVAHDIQSPLSALRMTLKVGRLELEDIELLRGASTRIKEISDSLLAPKDLSKRIESWPSSPSQLSEVSVVKCVEEIISEKDIIFKESGTPLRSNLVTLGISDAFFVGSPTEFKRMLSNLIDNAYESKSRDDHFVEIQISVQDGFLELKVKDNGKGIKKDLLGSVFQRGFSTKAFGGNGLGLSHARKWIDQMGGDLVVESEEGAGTTVTVRLAVLGRLSPST